MTFTKEELKSKSQGSQLTSEDLEQILKNQESAQKYNQLKTKLKEIEDDSYLIDRLEACDHSDAPKVLREFLESK